MKSVDQKPLHIAADKGNLAKIERLLATGTDLNATDSFGFTALEYALNSYPHIPDKDHLAIVQALVAGGADVNQRASNGQTPLFTAAAEGLYAVVVYLHQQGADLNARLDTGATALHETPDGIVNRPSNFTVTVQRDGKQVTLTDPDEIRKEIGSHPDDEFNARLDTVRYLIEQGIDVNAELSESGQTVLFRAADLGAEEIVALLIETGRIDLDHRDKWGLSALHYASRQGHPGIVTRLAQAGANINAQESYGFTPLHEAAENGQLAVVQTLIKLGADPQLGLTKSYQKYPQGTTAWDIARKAGKKRVIKYLAGLLGEA